MRYYFLLMVILLAVVGTAAAQEEAGSVPAELPASVRLEGLVPVWQQPNRCSSAALTIQMSYFGYSGTYADSISYLNPNIEDVSVRLEEMAAFAGRNGLWSIIRTGGTIELLQRIVAGGFPVLIENVYFDGADGWNDWMSHNRVMMGYDQATGALYFYDSLLGFGENNVGRVMSHDDVLTRWRPFNYNYMVLYRPEEEAILRAILGDHWDATYNAEQTLAMAEADLNGIYNDSFSVFNKASALLALGRLDEAVAEFDRALGLGLPPRFLWYLFGPFEAYLQVGRYDDVLDLSARVIASTPGVEEVYYYAGRAYEALGDLTRAAANYEVAIFRNANYAEAVDALARVRAAAGG